MPNSEEETYSSPRLATHTTSPISKYFQTTRSRRIKRQGTLIFTPLCLPTTIRRNVTIYANPLEDSGARPKPIFSFSRFKPCHNEKARVSKSEGYISTTQVLLSEQNRRNSSQVISSVTYPNRLWAQRTNNSPFRFCLCLCFCSLTFPEYVCISSSKSFYSVYRRAVWGTDSSSTDVTNVDVRRVVVCKGSRQIVGVLLHNGKHDSTRTARGKSPISLRDVGGYFGQLVVNRSTRSGEVRKINLSLSRS